MSRISPAYLAAALVFGVTACHHAKPAALAPSPSADSLAADNARRATLARAEAARRDSIARADAIATLDAKVAVLQARPDVHIRIEGNADDRGSDEYNLALSERRSAAARRYLLARGIAGTRIEIVSFGEERPVCRDEAESCWRQNRRDEFVATSGSLASTTRSQ
jgi:peptidoglycan-associated lipoprotein